MTKRKENQKSFKAPDLKQEVTIYKSCKTVQRPGIRITAERFTIERRKQVLSYYRVYTNDQLLCGTYEIDMLARMIDYARKTIEMTRVDDQEIDSRVRSTRRTKISAAEII